MRRRFLPLGPLALAASAVVLTACGGGSGTGSGGGGGHAKAATAGTPATLTLTTAGSPLGTLLTDNRKRTVYLFEKDAHGRSACSGACASVWPPLTVGAGAKPVASGGVSARLLGTTTRSGGVRQVTYAGHPLYYYVSDQRPGDTTGEGLDQFGAEWYLLAPKGTAIDR